MKPKLARYKCLGCGLEWQGPPEGMHCRCRRCESKYVEWTNYAKDFAK